MLANCYPTYVFLFFLRLTACTCERESKDFQAALNAAQVSQALLMRMLLLLLLSLKGSGGIRKVWPQALKMTAAMKPKQNYAASLVLAAIGLALITILSVWKLKQFKYRLVHETGGAMFFGKSSYLV